MTKNAQEEDKGVGRTAAKTPGRFENRGSQTKTTKWIKA